MPVMICEILYDIVVTCSELMNSLEKEITAVAVLISHIMDFACSSFRLSVHLSLLYGLLTRREKCRKPKIGLNVPHSKSNQCASF